MSALSEEEVRNMQLVGQNSVSATTRADYTRRVNLVREYFQEHHPDQIAEGQLAYTELDPEMFIGFLAMHIKKSNGNCCSKEHMRKYKNAVVWAAEEQRVRIPDDFSKPVDKWLSAFDSYSVGQQEEGLFDDYTSDPLSVSLFLVLVLPHDRIEGRGYRDRNEILLGVWVGHYTLIKDPYVHLGTAIQVDGRAVLTTTGLECICMDINTMGMHVQVKSIVRDI